MSEKKKLKQKPLLRERHFEAKRSERRTFLASYVRKGGVGVEFGVFWGHFSEVLIREAQPRRLYLVDPWDLQGESFGDWGEYTNFGTLRPADCYADVRQLERHPGVTVVRDYAERFLAGYTGEPFDWVYLDTSHKYDDTLSQLRLITGYLAADGVILGDDWITDRTHAHHEVFQAVHEFIRTSDFEIVMAGRGNQYVLRKRQARTPTP